MSVFEETVSILENLSEDDLKIIQILAVRMLTRPEESNPFRPMTEEEFLGEIDTALRHAGEGKTTPVAEVVKEMREKYGI